MRNRGLPWLFAVALASGCGSSSEVQQFVGQSNPNRKPPGKYAQTDLAIPLVLNDPFLTTRSSWTVSSPALGTALSTLPYLWSFGDLDVFSLYPSLSLPRKEIVVAVIDTGIDKDHEDLLGRLWMNRGEAGDGLFENGVDDDHDGFIDDFIGWDFVHENVNNPADDSGHGTHVSGTIAALGANGKGIVGVAPWVRIMPLKACNESGSCASADIRAALKYATDHGAKIVNISLGGEDQGADSLAFDQAIREATQAGVLVVVAAGNNHVDVSRMSPANATYAMAVGAHDNSGQRCSFASTGWKLDISAPGCVSRSDGGTAGILSLNSRKCGPLADRYCSIKNTVDEAYALKAGTSMAAPHIAGLAAVALTASPDATPLQLRQALLATARLSAPDLRSLDSGAGRASAVNLIDEARRAPGVKITGPRYGATASRHSIDFRIEARDKNVHWRLRAIQNPASLVVSRKLNLDQGSILSEGDVFALSSVDLSEAFVPSASGDHLIVLEAEVDGHGYEDVVLIRAP